MDEKQLYQILKEKYLEDLAESDDQYSRYDCYSLRHNLDIELKCRNRHYNNLILERKKYDALIARSEKHQTRPLYINSTPKGIYIFDLSKIKPEFHCRYLPKTTQFYNRVRVEKEVAYLDTKKATRFIPYDSSTN